MTKLKEGNVAAASELFQVEEFLRFEKTSKQHSIGPFGGNC